MNDNKNILELKNKILADTISAITIVDVDVKGPFDGSVSVYIKTNNLGTVEVDKLNEIANKYSSDVYGVEFLIPENKIHEAVEKNEDTVCIYIKDKTIEEKDWSI